MGNIFLEHLCVYAILQKITLLSYMIDSWTLATEKNDMINMSNIISDASVSEIRIEYILSTYTETTWIQKLPYLHRSQTVLRFSWRTRSLMLQPRHEQEKKAEKGTLLLLTTYFQRWISTYRKSEIFRTKFDMAHAQFAKKVLVSNCACAISNFAFPVSGNPP